MTDRLVLTNIRLVTMVGDTPAAVIEDAIVAAEGGRIVYAGPAEGRTGDLSGACDLGGALVTPGLVACHNAALWAGAPASARGQSGKDYRARVRAVAEATCAAPDDALLETLAMRTEALARSGVTACELKSGFGTTPAEELRLGRLLRHFADRTPMRTRQTLFIGHQMPEGADPDDVLAGIEQDIVPQSYELGVAGAVEVFCDDDGGLDLDACSTILELYYKKKTPSRVACDRFDDSAGATLPASFYSRAATFLNRTDDVGLEGLAPTSTVAILVPEACAADANPQCPPLDTLRRAGVRIALSSEAGPDGSGALDMLAVARTGYGQFGMSAEEVLLAVTRHAAAALGLADEAGEIAEGHAADLAIFGAPDVPTLLSDSEYRCQGIVRAGVLTMFD